MMYEFEEDDLPDFEDIMRAAKDYDYGEYQGFLHGVNWLCDLLYKGHKRIAYKDGEWFDPNDVQKK